MNKGRLKVIPIGIISILLLITIITEVQSNTEEASALENQTIEIQEGTNTTILPVDYPATLPVENEAAQEFHTNSLVILPIEEPSSEIEPIGNETEAANETENEVEIPSGQNETALPGTVEDLIVILPQPNLNLQLYSISKIIRGESTQITTIITNSGGPAKNLKLQWIIPVNFKILSGNLIANCGNLNTGESCTSIINIQTLGSASLGKNQLNIKTNY